jgi:integral membrane protein
MMMILNSYRKVALIEGVSYLILLFIAMPLKYIFDIPEPVKYFGWIHGVLFIAFIALLLLAAIKYKWTLKRMIIYFIASVIPFVPFYLEKELKKEYGALSDNKLSVEKS